MSDLIVIAYDDKSKAEEVRSTLLRFQKKYLVDLEDAVVVTKTKDGKVRLNQTYNIMSASIASGSRRELGEAFEPGTSALFILVREARLDKVLPEISRYGGKVLRTSPPKEQEEKIQAALMGEARNQATPQAA